MSTEIELATIVVIVTQEALLDSIWYSDGSGAHYGGVGIDGPSSNWYIRTIELNNDGNVRLVLHAKRDTP